MLDVGERAMIMFAGARRLAIALLLLCVSLAAFAQTVGETVYEKAAPAVVTITAGDSTGTGFLVRDKKTFVTAAHVIDNGEVPVIHYGKGTRLDVGEIAISLELDIAVLIVEDEVAATPLPLADLEPINPGAQVFALGTALGALSHTLTDGMFSAIREVEEISLIQVTTPFSPGMSGGPILNKDGGVLGVTSFSFTEGQNLNLAVAAKHIREVLERTARPTESVLASLGSGYNVDAENEVSSSGLDRDSEAWRLERLEALSDLLSTIFIKTYSCLDEFYEIAMEANSMSDWESVHAVAERTERNIPLISIEGETYETDVSPRVAFYTTPEEFEQLSSTALAVSKATDEAAKAWAEAIIESRSGLSSETKLESTFEKVFGHSNRVIGILDDYRTLIAGLYKESAKQGDPKLYETMPSLFWGFVIDDLFKANCDPLRPDIAAVKFAWGDSKLKPGDVIDAMRKAGRGSSWESTTNWEDVASFILSMEDKGTVHLRMRDGREVKLFDFGLKDN
jgi:hypothetical protein